MWLNRDKDKEYYKKLKELNKNIKKDGLGIKTKGNYPCIICGSYEKLYPIQTIYVCPSCYKRLHLSPLVRWENKPKFGKTYCPICGREVYWVYIINYCFVCLDCIKKLGHRQYKYNLSKKK